MDDSETQPCAVSERAAKWLEQVVALVGRNAAAFVVDGGLSLTNWFEPPVLES